MSEQLVAMVRDAPTERTVWLTLADWLQDRGDWRGEALVLHDRLAHEPLSPEAQLPLRQRLAALCTPVHSLQTLPEEHRAGIWSVTWHCGFVLAASLLGPRAAETFVALCAHPAGRLLGEVRFRGLDTGGAIALASVPKLAQIDLLSFWDSKIGTDGLHALVGSGALGRLTTLHVEGNRVGAGGAYALADSRRLPRLTALHLGLDGIGDEGARALAGSETLAALVTLDLRQAEIGNRGATALAHSTTLPALATLNLKNNQITLAGARTLVDSESLAGLQTLDLRENNLSPRSRASLSSRGRARGRTVLV